jgi:hypothetical protein
MSMTLQHLKSSLGAHQAYCPSLSMKFQPRKPGFLSLSDFAVSRGMKFNPKKRKEMVASFLDLQCIDSIYISGTPVERFCCICSADILCYRLVRCSL